MDSEEQVRQRLPLLLPKAKFGIPGDSDEETDDDAPKATPSVGDLKDDDELKSHPFSVHFSD